MKRLIFFIAASLVVFSGLAAGNAERIMELASGKVKNMKSLTATYELSSGNEVVAGTLAMSGDKFHISSEDIMVWYDGRTQWSYSSDTNEVNIIEPSPEELAAVNPFVIMSSLRKAYKAELLASKSSSYRLRLLPVGKNTSEIRKIVLTLNAGTYLPEEIRLFLQAGNVLNVKINSIKTGTNYPPATFVFNRKLLPKADIVDLR